MKKAAILGLVVLFFVVGGFFVLRSRSSSEDEQIVVEPSPTVSLQPIGEEVNIDFKPNASRTKAALVISNLTQAGVESLEYEILYETEGLTKGVNSGSKPIEIGESGTVERDIDFGTCSSGVCRYDNNVGTITLIIRFNTSEGPKLFKKEYP